MIEATELETLLSKSLDCQMCGVTLGIGLNSVARAKSPRNDLCISCAQMMDTSRPQSVKLYGDER